MTNGALAPDAVNRAIMRAIGEAFARRQQTQIELVLLATGLIGLPTADVQERRFAPERTAGLREIPPGEEDPGISRFWNDLEVPADAFLRPVFLRHESVLNVRVRMFAQIGHLRGDLILEQIVVRVEILHPFATREFEESVARDVAPAVRTSLEANSVSESLEDFEAPITRPVVVDDHLDRRIGLRQRALDRLPDPALGVVAGDQDGDEVVHVRGEGAAASRHVSQAPIVCMYNSRCYCGQYRAVTTLYAASNFVAHARS